MPFLEQVEPILMHSAKADCDETISENLEAGNLNFLVMQLIPCLSKIL